MDTAIARNTPTCASRLADQIAWADAHGYSAMAAVGVWTRIIGTLWRAIGTEAGADAIERLRGIRPTREHPAQHLIVETQAIRIAGTLGLIDNADVGALNRASTSIANAVAEGFAEDPRSTFRAGTALRECAGAVRKLGSALAEPADRLTERRSA